jgi:CubicO group peptidase (beta-lactamase class C family)
MTRRKLLRLVAAFALVSCTAGAQAAEPAYFPPRHEWQHASPQQSGMDAARLADAVAYAQAHDNPAPRDQALALAQSFGKAEPYFGGQLGPTSERAAANGLVVHRGRIVAEWGDTHHVDMTHSVTKSFLSAVVGLAWQKGLIRSTDDRAADYMPPDVDLFKAPHDAAITWEQLLRQTSDWQGTLWGKPDWADRPEGAKPEDWPQRTLHEPGTHYKYNDVRVNVLALAALQVWRRPLPEVLREEIMDPIGASSRWRWTGYQNSWVDLDGHKLQSVSGGGHWGGGMFIDAWDLARFGYLFLRDGAWDGRQLVAREWIAKARTPGPANAQYGYCNWFLNTGRLSIPAAPASSVAFLGNGQNVVYIDWENDLVAVVRWIDTSESLNEFVARLLASLRPR